METLFIPEELEALLGPEAAAQGLSVNEFINQIVRDFFQTGEIKNFHFRLLLVKAIADLENTSPESVMRGLLH